MQAAVSHIIESGGGSVVINCSDQWFVGKPYSFGYGLTKGALGQITRSLSIDLGKYGIRVNAVCAGTILLHSLITSSTNLQRLRVKQYRTIGLAKTLFICVERQEDLRKWLSWFISLRQTQQASALVAITSPMSDWWHNNIYCDNHGLYFGLADTKSS